MNTNGSNKPVLSLNGVSKVIKGKSLVKGLTFDVRGGEIFGFLGPNGAGKTTTIRMMVGLMSITSGDITIEGHSVKHHTSKAMRHVGAIVENPEMYKFLTGYQNLVHFARMYSGITKERINEVVALVGLQARIHDKVKTYSLGMRQRLGVAQALLHNPSVLILDEPTNGLDPAGIKELRDYLKKLAHEAGIAVIVSSHLLSEMELMCDRVAIIQHGELIEIQEIYEVTSEDEQQVLFQVDRPDEAISFIARQGTEVTRMEQGFLVSLDHEQTAVMNKKLVDAGIKVYGIAKQNKSLEDKFLEMTEGGIL